jgi:hypothetical protein
VSTIILPYRKDGHLMSIFKKGLPLFFLSLLLLLSMTALLAAKDSKMDPKELVALHLKSIGSPEALAAIKTIVNEGKGTVRMVGGGVPVCLKGRHTSSRRDQRARFS